MKIKIDFITNSSSTNYTISTSNKEIKEIEIKIQGIKFNLLKDISCVHVYKTMEDLKKNNRCIKKYEKSISSGKTIYEFWTSSDGGNLLESYLHLNDITDLLPDGFEFVDVYLGG
jgi:hypothetical protein